MRRLGFFDLLIYWFGPREPFQLGKVRFIKDSLVVCEGLLVKQPGTPQKDEFTTESVQR